MKLCPTTYEKVNDLQVAEVTSSMLRRSNTRAVLSMVHGKIIFRQNTFDGLKGSRITKTHIGAKELALRVTLGSLYEVKS